MILTKSELIDFILIDFAKTELRIIKRIKNKMFRIPEHHFISMIDSELNFKLEIVRKNLYIIT